MFRSNRNKPKKVKARREVLIADGKTSATIPNPGGLQVYGTIQCPMKLKFTCTTATTSTVTYANILDTVVMATTSTSLADVFYSARLKAVRIWTPPLAGSNAYQATIAFDSPSQGDQRVWVVSSGPTGGYCECKPSKSSANGKFWQDSSSIGAFTINSMPVGTLIELDLVFRSRIGPGSAVTAAQAGSGLTAGTIYLRGLDGLAAASTKFYPQPASYAA